MRIAGAISIIALLTLLAPAPAAAAQVPDFDCADFAAQTDAQAIFDQVPGDPYRLDPDGDGVACESTLPSGAQAVGYTGVALSVATLSGVALFAWQRRRLTGQVGDPLAERMSDLETGLTAMNNVLGGADFEVVEPAGEATVGMSTNFEDERELDAAHVRSLINEIRTEFDRAARRTTRVSIIVATSVAILSVTGAVLVQILVP